MKKITILLLSLVLFSVVYAQNETLNDTISNETEWYQGYVDKAVETDTMTIISVIIGLILVYLLGKLAFKLIKWTIIILAIILALKMIF